MYRVYWNQAAAAYLSLVFSSPEPKVYQWSVVRPSSHTFKLEWENGVSILARSFLIESSSKVLVTRTCIKAQMSLISGRIRHLILELLALEWQKFYTFELEYL